MITCIGVTKIFMPRIMLVRNMWFRRIGLSIEWRFHDSSWSGWITKTQLQTKLEHNFDSEWKNHSSEYKYNRPNFIKKHAGLTIHKTISIISRNCRKDLPTIWGEGPEGPSKIYMLLRMHSFAAILQSYKRLVDKFIVYTLIYFT